MTMYGNLKAQTYRLEISPDGPALRMFVNGERQDAAILVEPENGPEKYTRLDMPVQDKRILRGWMRGKRRKNNKP